MSISQAQSLSQNSAPVVEGSNYFRYLLGQVVQSHPSILSALKQLDAARKDVEGARWQFGPTPSIGFEESNQAINGLTDKRTAFARLQQPLWTGGRLTAQLEKAQAQETISSLVVDEQRLTLANRWVQLWAEVQSAELKVQAYMDSESLHRKYFEQVQSRAKERYAPRSDVQLAMTRLAAVQAELSQARTQKRQGISKLEQMYGAPLPLSAIQWTASLQSLKGLDAIKQKNVNDWLRDVEDKHPSLKKAAVIGQTARAEVELAKAKTVPELYIRGEILNGDVRNTTRQIYVGISSNFGSGLSTLSAISAAQAKLDAQESEIETRRRDIAEQVISDLQTLESQVNRLRFLDDSYKSADEFLQASERQFAAGRKSWQELMNTAREKAQTLTQLADAKTLQWLALQRLELLSTGTDAYLNANPNP